ncbi:MAG: hypothetical protein LUC86_01770, partial [Prevotellaceae bacterium]|nr:hypothetical protein [Prevotellaceae bacterium]
WLVVVAVIVVGLIVGFSVKACKQSKESEAVDITSGYINGHEYVDLGLSVKWATCNVGGSYPSVYGDYYAWGETSTKSSYDEDNCKTYNVSMGSIAGNSSYDAARANWGGTWRLPTADEIDELIDKCDWEWTTRGGHAGYKVTGPNGNSIFLPAAGWRYGTSLYIRWRGRLLLECRTQREQYAVRVLPQLLQWHLPPGLEPPPPRAVRPRCFRIKRSAFDSFDSFDLLASGIKSPTLLFSLSTVTLRLQASTVQASLCLG